MPSKRTYTILRLALCGLLVAALLFKVDLERLGEILGQADLRYLAAVFFLMFLNSSLSTQKWRLLLRADNLEVPFFYLLRSYLISGFVNLFFPSIVGGDAYRVYDVAQRSKRSVKSFAAVFVDRGSGLCALSIIGLLGFQLGVSSIADRRLYVWGFVVCGGIFLACISLLLPSIRRFIRRAAERIPRPRLARAVKETMTSLDVYSAKGAVLWKCLGIALCFHVVLILCVFLIAKALRYETPLLCFFMFVPIINVIQTIPLTPNSVGTREWAYVLLFTQVGLETEEALLLALTYGLVTVLYALIGGLLLITRRHPSAQAEARPEARAEGEADPQGAVGGGRRPEQ